MTSITQASVPHKEKGCFSPVFCGCCVFAVALFSHFTPEPRIFLSVSGGEEADYGNNMSTLKTWLRQASSMPIRQEGVPTQLQGRSANGFQS